MPSPRHDAITKNFVDDPGLAPAALREFLDIEVPAGQSVQIDDNQFNDRTSIDFQADAVVTVGPPRHPIHGIIVEIQQSWSESKRRQLPRYAAALWLRLRCPVDVLVVCPSAADAARYRRPIETSLRGYKFEASVLGPEEIPVLTDPKEISSNPNLAALKMMAHGHLNEVREIFVKGLEGLPHDYAMEYYVHVQRMAADPVGKKLEELVKKTTVYSDFVREHEARGEARGEVRGEVRGGAKILLQMLTARGLEVSEDVRARINGCQDLDQLETWASRAMTAHSVEDLFQ